MSRYHHPEGEDDDGGEQPTFPQLSRHDEKATVAIPQKDDLPKTTPVHSDYDAEIERVDVGGKAKTIQNNEKQKDPPAPQVFKKDQGIARNNEDEDFPSVFSPTTANGQINVVEGLESSSTDGLDRIHQTTIGRRFCEEEAKECSDEESGHIPVHPGAQRIAGIPMSDRPMRHASIAVGSIDNLNYLFQDETIMPRQMEEVAAVVVNEDELREELIGDIAQAEIVAAPMLEDRKSSSSCRWIVGLFTVALIVGIFLMAVLIPPSPTSSPTNPPSKSYVPSTLPSEAPVMPDHLTETPSQEPSFRPTTSPGPSHGPTSTQSPTDFYDTIGLEVSMQCDHNVWTEETEDCNYIPFPPLQPALFSNPLELLFKFTGGSCVDSYYLNDYEWFKCQDLGNMSDYDHVFIEFIGADEMSNFGLSFDDVSISDLMNVSDTGIILPDRMNVTVYDNISRDNRIQTVSFPTFTVPDDGSRDYFLLDRFGGIQLVAYMTPEFGLISSLLPDYERYRDINLIVTITAKKRVQLDELSVISNYFGVFNLTSEVHGKFVDGRPTSQLLVIPETIDLLNRSRYTFFATVIGNIMGESYNSFDFYEFVAGWN